MRTRFLVRFLSCRRGYSLVEVLIASVLIGIAIVSVFQAVSQGSRINRREFITQRAYQYLEQVLEDPQHSYTGSYYVRSCGDSPEGHLVPSNTVYLDSVVLDPGDNIGPEDDLVGAVKLWVESRTVDVTIAGTVCFNIPLRKLKAVITYTDDGVEYTDSLETIVTLVNIN